MCRFSRGKIWVLVLAAVFLAFSVLGFSQEDGGGDLGTPAGEEITLLQVIRYGGVIELIIILLSVAGLALIIEQSISIRRDALVPPEVLGEVEVLFEEEQYEEALELCEAENSFLTRVLAAGLSKSGAGYDAMVEAMEESGEEETVRLNQKVGFLSLIGSTAPMLGLLGTVTGMIAAFNKIAQSAGSAQAKDLAEGISQALITTASGLIVAIPVMAAFFIFKNKVIKVSLEVGAVAGELMDRFRGS